MTGQTVWTKISLWASLALLPGDGERHNHSQQQLQLHKQPFLESFVGIKFDSLPLQSTTNKKNETTTTTTTTHNSNDNITETSTTNNKDNTTAIVATQQEEEFRNSSLICMELPSWFLLDCLDELMIFVQSPPSSSSSSSSPSFLLKQQQRRVEENEETSNNSSSASSSSSSSSLVCLKLPFPLLPSSEWSTVDSSFLFSAPFQVTIQPFKLLCFLICADVILILLVSFLLWYLKRRVKAMIRQNRRQQRQQNPRHIERQHLHPQQRQQTSFRKKKKEETSASGDCADDLAFQRKQDFLQRQSTTSMYEYGYQDTPAGWIDLWRLREFPGLIAPLILTEDKICRCSTTRTTTTIDDDDNKNDKDSIVQPKTRSLWQDPFCYFFCCPFFFLWHEHDDYILLEELLRLLLEELTVVCLPHSWRTWLEEQYQHLQQQRQQQDEMATDDDDYVSNSVKEINDKDINNDGPMTPVEDEVEEVEDEVYLDYAGAALPWHSQLQQQAAASSTILANPHSTGPAAARTIRWIQKTEKRILEWLDATPGIPKQNHPDTSVVADHHHSHNEGYDLVFTSGATESFRIVAERFPFECKSLFLYPQNAHTSLVGMTASATAKNATILCRPLHEIMEWLALQPPSSSSSLSTSSSTPFWKTHPILKEVFHCSCYCSCGNASSDSCWDNDGKNDNKQNNPETEEESSFTVIDPLEENEDKRKTIPPTTAAGDRVCTLCRKQTKQQSQQQQQQQQQHEQNQPIHTHHHLIALPIECNFSGDRPKQLVAVLDNFRRQAADATAAWSARRCSGGCSCQHQISIFLDIAKAASTGPVSLRQLNPDFACLSFYKVFGEPTGLGGLLVKQSSVDRLAPPPSGGSCDGAESNDRICHANDTRLISRYNTQGAFPNNHRQLYFGGGSVDVLLPTANVCVLRSSPSPLASLTHGTSHFRGILAVNHGLDVLERLGGMQTIRRHSCCLAQEFVRRLNKLQHDNGTPVVNIYGEWGKRSDKSCSPNAGCSESVDELPGPTVTFNILREDGSYVGYNEVSKLANLNRPPIQLRTGCFCNPGACQLALGLSNDVVMKNYIEGGHVCGDDIDVINGQPTGAIRASFGKDSIWEDLDALVVFIERLYVSKCEGGKSEKASRWNDGKPRNVILSEIFLFPIKSCAAQKVKKWRLVSTGLKLAYDREFALVDGTGIAMRLQLYPKMAFIQPSVDDETKTMSVSAPNMPDLVLDLTNDEMPFENDSIVKVCGNNCGAVVWGSAHASEWFSNYLGVQCWLARHSSVSGNYDIPNNNIDGYLRPERLIRNKEIGFANDQPILLISEHAVDALNDVLRLRQKRLVSSRHFRPNLVVRLNGGEDDILLDPPGHTEDGWTQLTLKEKKVTFAAVGQCARCSMVDIDPSSGTKGGEALRALAEYRRKNGQIMFGIFLTGASTDEMEPSDPYIEEGDLIYCE